MAGAKARYMYWRLAASDGFASVLAARRLGINQ